jgi:hypothetical protein
MEGFESDSSKSVVFGHILYCKINEQINYLYTRLNFVRLIGGQARSFLPARLLASRQGMRGPKKVCKESHGLGLLPTR